MRLTVALVAHTRFLWYIVQMGCSQSNPTRRSRRARSQTLAYSAGTSTMIKTVAFASILLPEIIDTIIDQLHADRKSLSACSLTCKNWLTCSRYHLFSQVVLAPRDFSAFISFIEHPSNFISDFVQWLVLDDVGNSLGHEYTRANISRLKSYLPGVRSLQLTNVNLKSNILETIISTFCEIKELGLHLMAFDKFSDFVDLVCSFPLLESLSINQVKWLHSTTPASPHIRRLPPFFSMRFLDLCDSNAVDVAEWLFAQDSMPTVEILHFDTHRYEPNHAVRRIIESSGPTIRHLQFDLTFANEIRDNLQNSIDLGRCTNLRLLHLHNIILLSGFVMTSKTPRWVPKLLSQVTSPVMEEVVFTLLVDRNDDLERFDWAGAGEALSHARFTNLKKIRIRMVDTDPINVGRADIARVIREDKLPTFHRRGILQVEFPDSEGC